MAARVGTSATERPTTSCTSTGQARSRSSPPFQTSPRVGSAAVVSLAPDAATRKGQVKPRLVALVQHPIALAVTPDGLAVVDYGGAPGERGKGELRLLSSVGTAAAAGTGPLRSVGRSRLLASGLDRPTGVARLPDGRWAIAETGHTGLTVLSSSRS
jgi:glucose/arabinose dehydrogenase